MGGNESRPRHCQHEDEFFNRTGIYQPYNGILPTAEWSLLTQLNHMNLKPSDLSDKFDMVDNPEQLNVLRTLTYSEYDHKWHNSRTKDFRSEYVARVDALVQKLQPLNRFWVQYLFVSANYDETRIDEQEALSLVERNEEFVAAKCPHLLLNRMLDDRMPVQQYVKN